MRDNYSASGIFGGVVRDDDMIGALGEMIVQGSTDNVFFVAD
jgi:hypothetical protein